LDKICRVVNADKRKKPKKIVRNADIRKKIERQTSGKKLEKIVENADIRKK